jgi:hypothetical protein
MSDSSPETREQRIYNIILKMVLWGERTEDIFKKLEVAGFSEEKQKEMYARARAERVAAIRGDCWRKAGWGLLALSVAVGVFCGFWIGLGGIPRIFIGLCAVGAVFGAWWLIEGLVGVLTAPMKEGSVATDI